jgi:hypothetical protein
MNRSYAVTGAIALLVVLCALRSYAASIGPILWIDDDQGNIGTVDVHSGAVTLIGNAGVVAMNHIVRRTSKNSEVQQTVEALPARSHRSDDITVASQLSLGVEPRLSLAWRVTPWCWRSGFTLLVFRSMTGFSAERRPEDLNKHGQLIIETKEDGVLEEVPQEGSHFFTFVLHKKILLGLSEMVSVLRFSETVPSAKVAIGRIRDQIELQEMLERHEVGEIEHEAKRDEAKVRRIRSRMEASRFPT